MPRHKTAHRKVLEARNREQAKTLSALLAEAKDDPTLKENAQKAAKRIK
jgi:hypothetical protein